jgi:hypothetical protein
MEIQQILELQKKHQQQRLICEMQEARQKNKQDLVNSGISIFTKTMNNVTLGFMYSALNKRAE